MRELISFILPAVSLYIYMVLSSIEYGVSFFYAFPKFFGDTKILRNYMQPIWEVTNVFLVFALISIMAFFPGALFSLGTYLLVPLFLGLVCLGLRSLYALIILYGNVEGKIIRFLFFLASFLSPIFLSEVFVYMLTGKTSSLFVSPLNAVIDICVISSIFLLSATFFTQQTKDAVQRKNLGLISWISFLTLFFTFYISLFIFIISHSYLGRELISGIFLPIILGICLFIIFFVFEQFQHLRFIIACFFTFFIYMFFLYAHFPYIIFPRITMYNSFTSTAAFPFLLGSFLVGMLFVIPGLYLLYYLFFHKKIIV